MARQLWIFDNGEVASVVGNNTEDWGHRYAIGDQVTVVRYDMSDRSVKVTNEQDTYWISIFDIGPVTPPPSDEEIQTVVQSITQTLEGRKS